MTTGSKIRECRRAAGLRLSDVADSLGVSVSTLSQVENDAIKCIDPAMVVKISETIGDRSILTTYLQNNPAYQAVIPKVFPDLNNIRRDPAIIFSRFATEAEEAVEAARILADMFSDADPSARPAYCETLFAKLEQIVDVQRAAEILFVELVSTRIITDADRCEIHRRQQQKCIAHGHHKTAVVEEA